MTNTEVIEAAYAAFAEGDIEGLLALHTEDAVWLDNSPAASPLRGTWEGHEGILDLIGHVPGLLELEQGVDHLLADGDTVVAVLSHRITHAVSGKVDEGRAVHVWHLNDGKIDHLEVFPPESEDFYR
ncbi:MAG: nuclear transport factor 2 family protein [Nitriliruptorales bacterium]|nr:nuclear transport factor 2 family protein [Nitriliruptorales bacterium]